MPLPLGPLGWLFTKCEQLVRWRLGKREQRALENAVIAWKNLDSGLLSNSLADYYEKQGVKPLFCHGVAQRVPIYLRQGWRNLTSHSLVMAYENVERPVERDKDSERFFDVFSNDEFRKRVGLDQLGDNGEVFRLVRIESVDDQLKLH